VSWQLQRWLLLLLLGWPQGSWRRVAAPVHGLHCRSWQLPYDLLLLLLQLLQPLLQQLKLWRCW
jgi:hypothetical protein